MTMHAASIAPAAPARGAAPKDRPAVRLPPLRVLPRPSLTALQPKCDGCEKEEKLQAKLEISEPGDALETEADAVADRVMRMTDAAAPVAFGGGRSTAPADVSGVPDAVQGGLASPGRPLDAGTRAFFEPRMGFDLGSVRVHADDRAAASAHAVGAKAYTIGSDIVFGSGHYAPGSGAGRHLLAHELAHVVQQAEGRAASVQRACSRNIFAEGTCDFLTKNSRFICCNPNGIERPGRDKDIDGTPCPSNKFTPIFTCDNNCKTALSKGCSDDDNWMAVPNNQFQKSSCGDVYTICANGKSTKAYVRDHSVTETRFEVSPGIQKALGVKVGDSFMGAVYIPGAAQDKIDADTCCKEKAADKPKPKAETDGGPSPATPVEIMPAQTPTGQED